MNVAILGLGVVGRGVYEILMNDFNDIEVTRIVELDQQKLEGISPKKVSTFEEAIQDKTIDIGSGLSAFAINAKKPIKLDQSEILKLQSSGQIERIYGTMCHSWILNLTYLWSIANF